ncbi:hypothetical protein [Haloprofundus halophilus]|uniref:hypothetical protein n=1 Tax=Haloprofundus halophilus TaxID=2283527 RepID=UPI000E43D80E|nr:hypothetical protein [Haloprofundus halophilus]
MAAEISDWVREIAEAHGLPEIEVFGRALERDLEDLWEGLILTRYLDGELDCEEAIERISRTKVKSERFLISEIDSEPRRTLLEAYRIPIHRS